MSKPLCLLPDEAYIKQCYYYLHEHPELSGQEEQTVLWIAQQLDALSIPYVIVERGGVLATLRGTRDNGRSILLRADIDALPIQESDCNLSRKRTCKSRVDGVMHACGHDGHTAMLLGAGKLLSEHLDSFAGTVYLCFERGEELTANVIHLLAYMEKEGIRPDTAFGLHLMSALDSGTFGINDRAVMAANMKFDVSILGKGGHASRPDQAINPLDAFTAIYTALPALRTRFVSPLEPLTCAIGAVETDGSHNVIANRVRFRGTMRTFDVEGAGEAFYQAFRDLIASTCALYHCEPVFDVFTRPTPAVINDPICADLARRAIGAALGTARVGTCEPWLASESFSLYRFAMPSVFAFLGIRNEAIGTGAPHHNPAFEIDESVLGDGATAAVAYACAFLESDVETASRRHPKNFRDALRECGETALLSQLDD